MKQNISSSVVVLLLAGYLLTAQLVSAQDEEDWKKCAGGSDLFDPPECPDTDPDLPVYFPFPYDCEQYFECTNGIARCIKCAPGTIWDQENTICNHPAVVNCTIVTTREPTPPTTTTTATPTNTTTTPTTTTTTTTTPTNTTTELPTTIGHTEPPPNWICPEDYVGFMRHPSDCRLFYHCDPVRRPCLFECPDMLYFNPVHDRCDLPSNVPDCVGGSPPPTSTVSSLVEAGGSSVNYRNADRFYIAQNVQFVANLFSGKWQHADDPCQVIRKHIGA